MYVHHRILWSHFINHASTCIAFRHHCNDWSLLQVCVKFPFKVFLTFNLNFYRKYWKTILKNGTFDYHSNNSFSNMSSCEKNFGTLPKKKSNNKDEFNEAYRSSSTVSIFGSGLQKTFATGNLSRICQIPVMNPINKSNSSHFSDDSEPIYTDPSLFEKSR